MPTTTPASIFTSKTTSGAALPKRTWWQLPSSRIAVGFVVWSALWVVFSDFVVHHTIVRDAPKELWTLETAKGLAYVLVTGIMLYAFIRAREREYFAARRTSESRLRRLSESNLISICYWRSSGEITDANDAFLNLIGYTRDDLLNHRLNWWDFTPPEYHKRDNEQLQVLASDARHVAYEKEFIRKDHTRVPVLVGAALLDGSNRRGISYALDLTPLKNAQQRTAALEDQLRQSQKLEAVGQLASGIAHDFNNLLNIMIGYACMIEARVSSDSTSRDHVQHVLKAADKASTLIRKLLAFGRKQVLKPELLDINTILRDYEQIMPRIIGETIHCEFRLEPSLWPVELDRTQFEQVVLNLIVNARDAMPFGGALILTTSNDQTNRNVCVEFTDTGIGMDEEIKRRVFDPFFTTKPEGQGTGLGLSTVYGIVTQSGGQITVASEPRRGSTFCVYFPAAHKSLSSPPSREFPLLGTKDVGRVGSSSRRSETILIAEDEPDLRELLTNLLRTRGFRVLTADDGETAISIAKSHRGPIELLLTDIVMPNKHGVEAAHEIRLLRPEVKVIFMTGYAEEAFTLNPSGEKEVLLEKPVAPATLFEAIREMLNGDSAKKLA